MSDHNQEAERAARELLPCPMCGETAAMPKSSRGTYHYVCCDNCFLQIGPYDTPLEAQEAWNRRHPAVGEDDLPPLPTSQAYVEVWNCDGKSGASLQSANQPYYTAEQYRQGQREAFEAGRIEGRRDQHETHVTLLRQNLDLRSQLARNSQDNPSIERRRDLVHAKLPLDAEVALEHAALALDKAGDQPAHDQVVQVLAAHLPPEYTEGGAAD